MIELARSKLLGRGSPDRWSARRWCGLHVEEAPAELYLMDQRPWSYPDRKIW